MNAWNPCQLSSAALPPCHYAYQFYISDVRGLSCICNCRSQDLCAGTPFNIASTALFTRLLAHILYIPADRIILNMGDAHIYEEHFDGATEQIGRDPLLYPKPKLTINKAAPPKESSIDEKMQWLTTLVFEDITISDYECYPPIKYKMIA